LLLLLAAADWALLRAGLVRHDPALLTAIVASSLAAFFLRCLVIAWSLRRPGHLTWSTLSELVLSVGVLLALLFGMANWVLRLHGFVVLNEHETALLHGGTDLQVFEAGPLARLEEMNLTLALDELELVPAGQGGFLPRSHLRVWRGTEDAARLEIEPSASAASGSLRFLQGAFGFAPRVVILRGEETVFDRVVPFRTERRGPSGVTFEGRFRLEGENLDVAGAVSLASLDEGMRGHATLQLTVARDGNVIGRGSLVPGHFAEIGEGYQVGFAGLDRWSEVLVSRRNYRTMVLLGVGMALLGAAVWPLAAWRGW
jgi:hypothetical protein